MIKFVISGVSSVLAATFLFMPVMSLVGGLKESYYRIPQVKRCKIEATLSSFCYSVEKFRRVKEAALCRQR